MSYQDPNELRNRYSQYDEEDDDVSEMQHTPLNQENAFIRYVTQLDPIPGILPSHFLRRNFRSVVFSGKIKALSFFSNPKSIELNHCYRGNMDLEISMGLYGAADRTLMASVDTCQMTRGTNGNLQHALNTQRREFKDTSGKEKTGIMSRIMKGREESENMGYGAQEYQ